MKNLWIAIAAMMFAGAYAHDFTIVNKTENNIQKITFQYNLFKTTSIDKTIDSGTSASVSVPRIVDIDDLDEITLVLDNGKTVKCDIEDSLKKITVTRNAKISAKLHKQTRKKSTSNPAGTIKIKNDTDSRIVGVAIRPINTQEWLKCECVNSSKNWYKLPAGGNCAIKISLDREKLPELKFSNSKKGYDMAKIAEFTVSSHEYDADVR